MFQPSPCRLGRLKPSPGRLGRFKPSLVKLGWFKSSPGRLGGFPIATPLRVIFRSLQGLQLRASKIPLGWKVKTLV